MFKLSSRQTKFVNDLTHCKDKAAALSILQKEGYIPIEGRIHTDEKPYWYDAIKFKWALGYIYLYENPDDESLIAEFNFESWFQAHPTNS